jgi:hypothetical protein
MYGIFGSGVFGREFTKYMVMYFAYIWFWPTLLVMRGKGSRIEIGNLDSQPLVRLT